MRRQYHLLGTLSLVAVLAASGCRPQQPFYFGGTGDTGHYRGVAQEMEYPDVEVASLDEVEHCAPPLTLDNPKPERTWELGLEEAMRIALENSTVIKNLGGVAFGPSGAQGMPSALLQSPLTAATIYMPALEESNPRTGVEGAISAFDPQFSTNVFWEKNGTPQNIAGFVSFFRPDVLRQDLGSFQAQLAKQTATGATLALRHNVRYEWNNTPTSSRRWPSDWATNIEAEIRQPLLQRAGVQYNRIAGPGAIPGFNNGVLIARLRVDQSLADFEGAVRQMVYSTEEAYWNLYFAYRRLDAAIAGRDSALATWQVVHAKFVAGHKGGSMQEESQARAQYFLFTAAVHQSQQNLYRTERMVRSMLGLAPSDGRIICPSDEPSAAKVAFPWPETVADGLVRSVELRKQKWHVKEAELELIAAKNYLLPRLDGVARYRWLGLADDLLSQSRGLDDTEHVNNAYASMTGGDFQEWHLGLELSFPFGFRREMAGVRYAQLSLTRERKVLQEQELELVHQLQHAVGDLVANYQLAQDRYDQRAAAQREVKAVQAAYDLSTVTVDLLLDAQRRLAEAENELYRALVDYNLSIAQVHLRKGTLLEYNGVLLAEGPWPAKAYFDARRRARHRDAAQYIDYGFTQPKVLSRGPYSEYADSLKSAQEGGAVAVDSGEAMALGGGPSPKAEASEAVAPPRPAPIEMLDIPDGPASDPSQGPPAGQPKPKGKPLGAKAPPRHNGSGVAARESYDLGRLDLQGLTAGAGAKASAVRPASHQQTSPRRESGDSSASPGGRPSIEAPDTAHEPLPHPPSARTDPSASGWQAVQH